MGKSNVGQFPSNHFCWIFRNLRNLEVPSQLENLQLSNFTNVTALKAKIHKYSTFSGLCKFKYSTSHEATRPPHPKMSKFQKWQFWPKQAVAICLQNTPCSELHNMGKMKRKFQKFLVIHTTCGVNPQFEFFNSSSLTKETFFMQFFSHPIMETRHLSFMKIEIYNFLLFINQKFKYCPFSFSVVQIEPSHLNIFLSHILKYLLIHFDVNLA